MLFSDSSVVFRFELISAMLVTIYDGKDIKTLYQFVITLKKKKKRPMSTLGTNTS